MPENEEDVVYRDPSSGFVAYVPKGSIAKGEALVKTGNKLPQDQPPCGTRHGGGVEMSAPSTRPGLAGRHPTMLSCASRLEHLRNGQSAGGPRSRAVDAGRWSPS